MGKYLKLTLQILNIYIFFFHFLLANASSPKYYKHKLNTFLLKNISPALIRESNKNHILISKQDIDFTELKDSNKIKKDYSIGKPDPFSVDLEFSIKKNIKLISLLGIVSNGKDHYALIKYKEKIGELSIGDVGEETTNLLPKNVKLIEIIVNKSEIIIGFKDQKYTISIY